MNFCELFKKNYEYSKTRSLWTFYEQKNIFLWTIRLEILFWQHWMESQFCFDHFFATTLLSVFGSTIWVCCFDTLFATTQRIWFDYLSVLLRQFFCYNPCWVCCFNNFFATTPVECVECIWFDYLSVLLWQFFRYNPVECVECVECIWFDYLSVLLRQFFRYNPCWVCWVYLVRLFECVASKNFLLQPPLLSVLSVLSVFGSTICASTIFASNLKNRKTA